MALVENPAILEEVEEICATLGLDAVGVGSGDMGQSLGASYSGMPDASASVPRSNASRPPLGQAWSPVLAMPTINAPLRLGSIPLLTMESGL